MSKLIERIETAMAQAKVSTVYVTMDDLAELGEDPADYGGEGVAFLTPEKIRELLTNASNTPRVAKRKRAKVPNEDHAGDGAESKGEA